METVKILRQLWRRRVVVSVIAAGSILLGLALTYRVGLPPESRRYNVGVAGARILIDTPKSQFVEVAPLGADTLGQRANVLAALMAEGDIKAAIARRAQLAPDDLLASSESSEDPDQVSASDLKAPGIFLLHTRVVRDSEGGQLPIIEVETQAPDSAGATRLVNAAVSGVGEYLDSKAAGEQIADRRRLKVSSLGINPGRLEVRGPGLVIGTGAGIFAFLVGCVLLLVGSAMSRNWREAEAHEHDHQDAMHAADSPSPSRSSHARLEPVADDPKAEPPTRAVHGRNTGWGHPEKVVKASEGPPVGHDGQARPSGPPERPLRRAAGH